MATEHNDQPDPTEVQAEVQPLESRTLFSAMPWTDAAPTTGSGGAPATYVLGIAEGSAYSGSRGDSNRLSD